MASPVRLNAFAAVFTVADVAASLGFYVGRLGFREHFRLGDPPSYAIIERDAVSLHLMPASEAPESRVRSSIYVCGAYDNRLQGPFQPPAVPIQAPPTHSLHGIAKLPG